MAFVQAARDPHDGAVGVKRSPVEGFLIVSVITGGVEETILMSEFNAARVFAMLGFMLADGGPTLLSKAAGRIAL